MNKKAGKDSLSPRELLTVFLAFFTSRVCQRTYFGSLPKEQIAYELCRIWFDQVFSPGMRYLDGLKGDYDREAARQFRAAFSAEEWKYVERFHRFLELRIDMMPDLLKKQRRLLDNTLWQSIVRDATYLLELLEPDVKKRGRLVEGAGEFLTIPPHDTP